MVSAIIPARNEEASSARAVESVASQPEIEEVIVVNDQSTDNTAAILAELAVRIPKVKILNTDALPPGWVGKNYAVAMGAAAARGDWLLFTDADTDHMPGSTRRALNDAVDRNAVLVSYSPEQELGSFSERALIPFVYCRLGAKFSYSQVNDPARPEAAANGQFLMVLRDAYRRDSRRRRTRAPHEARRIRDLFHGSDGHRAHAHVSQLSRHVAGLDEESLSADRRQPPLVAYRAF
jgi:glycosyltransferase involved in cell wall biosynthesis